MIYSSPPIPASPRGTSPTQNSRLEKFFARADPARGRVILAIDATASRQPSWDRAAQLQVEMFAAVAAIGGLDVQLVYFRGTDECVASRWISDARALGSIMSAVTCRAGHTQIAKVFAHAAREHGQRPANALIIISDACEETPAELYAKARDLGVPVFLFQEGRDPDVAAIYTELARLSGGATAHFDASAAQRLANLLKAVAAFATGGTKALAAQGTDAAILLLTQVRK